MTMCRIVHIVTYQSTSIQESCGYEYQELKDLPVQIGVAFCPQTLV